MLSKETVEHVSKLARLKLTEEEIAEFSKQLSLVLENFEQIAAVDTTGVMPLVTPTDMSVTLRADVVDETIVKNQVTEKILENAPEKSGRLFKVPPVQ